MICTSRERERFLFCLYRELHMQLMLSEHLLFETLMVAVFEEYKYINICLSWMRFKGDFPSRETHFKSNWLLYVLHGIERKSRFDAFNGIMNMRIFNDFLENGCQFIDGGWQFSQSFCLAERSYLLNPYSNHRYSTVSFPGAS